MLSECEQRCCGCADVRRGMDGLIEAIKLYKGGVISISHDERYITNTSDQVICFLDFVVGVLLTIGKLWVCAEGKLTKFMGSVGDYKVRSVLSRSYNADSLTGYHCQPASCQDQADLNLSVCTCTQHNACCALYPRRLVEGHDEDERA